MRVCGHCRSQPSSTLPTLSAYLTITHPLLFLILQIPPFDPSTSLRTALLLRLTGEVLNSIVGYLPDTKTLPQLLAWLQDLDEGWLAILRAQTWHTEAHEGVDIVLPDDVAVASLKSTPVSQTERTRLRSLLIAGTSNMEEWFTGLDTGEEEFEVTLERLGLQQGFDDLFSGTLSEMGFLHGSMELEGPEGMEGTC